MPRLTQLDRTHFAAAFRNRPIAKAIADAFEKFDDAGVIPHATLEMSSQPTAADTIGIGADTYEFVTAGGNVTNNANIAVVIGGTAAATRDNLIAAVNAQDEDGLHATINNVADTAPALANGTENVLADAVGTTMRIRTANAPGGALTPANPDILLAESITAAADVWEEGNVNVNTLGGQAELPRQTVMGTLTVTAAMITQSTRLILLPFEPSSFSVQVRTSAGDIRGHGADTFATDAEGILVTFGGGADPDIQSTDVVTIIATE